MTEDPADTPTIRAAPSNVEQLRAWDGDSGTYWVAHADRYDEGVAAHHARFLEAAAIDPAEHVLDIGCGNGQTTHDAARRAPAGSALGVDLSSQMIELARRRAEREQLANARFQQADAQDHPFREASFDIAISRTGSMFFGDPEAAFANIARAVRPGGRLVLLTWQPFERNEWIRTFFATLAAGRDLPPPGAPGPFSLSDPDRVEQLLSAAGFTDVRLQSLVEPMYFGPDPEEASRFVAGQFATPLGELDADCRARSIGTLREDMAAHQTERGVLYESASWLVAAVRR